MIKRRQKNSAISLLITAVICLALAIGGYVLAGVHKQEQIDIPVYYSTSEISHITGNQYNLNIAIVNKTDEDVVIEAMEIRAFAKSNSRVYGVYQKRNLTVPASSSLVLDDHIEIMDVNDGTIFDSVRPYTATIGGKKYDITDIADGHKYNDILFLVLSSIVMALAIAFATGAILMFVKSKKANDTPVSPAQPSEDMVNKPAAPTQPAAKQVKVTEVIPHKNSKGEKVAPTEFVKQVVNLTGEATIGSQKYKIKLADFGKDVVIIDGVKVGVVEIIDGKINKQWKGQISIKHGESKNIAIQAPDRNGYFKIEVL